jgi:signal-transduction protein with cAMP-binding, CBS, and nucleotidyltransferase domain
MKITDYMISPVVSINAQSTVEEGAILFSEKKISSLLVKENEDYIGIITKTDIIEKVIAKGLDPKTTKISSAMSQPILTMDHYLPRNEAHEFMLKKKIKHLVVTKFGKVAGILTLKDMVI